MAYDVHVSDILFRLVSFFSRCCVCVGRVFDCNQQLESVWSVYVHFLTLATSSLWVHLMTKMKSNRLYRNIIFLLNILCLILFVFGFVRAVHFLGQPETKIEKKCDTHTHAYIKISHNQCHQSSSTPWLRHFDQKNVFSTWYVLYHVSIFLVFRFFCWYFCYVHAVCDTSISFSCSFEKSLQ